MLDQASPNLPHLRDYLPQHYLQRLSESEMDELNQIINNSGVLICDNFPEDCLDNMNEDVCCYVRLVGAYLGDRRDPKSLEVLLKARSILNEE
jgi:hypothetical protein